MAPQINAHDGTQPRLIPSERICALVATLLELAHSPTLDSTFNDGAAQPIGEADGADEDTGEQHPESTSDIAAESGWRYLHAVRRIARMDVDEERALFAQMRAHQCDQPLHVDARDRLIESNLWVVPIIVRRFYRGAVGFDDLVAEGNMGLYRALNRFDPERKFRFSTYAKWWVVDAVTAAMAASAYPVRVPRRVALAMSKQRRSDTAEPLQTGGTKDVDGAEAASIESGESLADPSAAVLHDDEHQAAAQAQPEEVALQRELLELLARAVMQLPARERKVIEERYGLNRCAERTLQEIGRDLGVTAERVRTLQLAAMAKLRQVLNEGTASGDSQGGHAGAKPK